MSGNKFPALARARMIKEVTMSVLKQLSSSSYLSVAFITNSRMQGQYIALSSKSYLKYVGNLNILRYSWKSGTKKSKFPLGTQKRKTSHRCLHLLWQWQASYRQGAPLSAPTTKEILLNCASFIQSTRATGVKHFTTTSLDLLKTGWQSSAFRLGKIRHWVYFYQYLFILNNSTHKREQRILGHN